jgi:hypothetical protein
VNAEILKPVIALTAWSTIMWVWLYAARLPAMSRARIDGTKMIGSTGGSLRDDLIAAGEARASWVADNYNHLMEQPTVFYAVAIVLALIGQGNGLNATLAWAYVGLRVAHSLVQVLINRVFVRFALFMLSALVLAALVVNASITALTTG